MHDFSQENTFQGHTEYSSLSSISESLHKYDGSTVHFSIEFFPPRNKSEELRLWRSIRTVNAMGALFASVTYGAGGATAHRSFSVAKAIQEHTGLRVLAHMTTVNQTKEELEKLADQLWGSGLYHILALRGDSPGGPLVQWVPTANGVDRAIDLIYLLKERASFEIAVAAFPEGNFRAQDLNTNTQILVDKFRAGAQFAITQMFFNVDDFLRLRDRISAIAPEFSNIPLVPGIMPITSVKVIEKLLQLSDSVLPESIRQPLYAAAQADEQNLNDIPSHNVRDLGIEIATDICRKLIREGVPCLHFCTLNYTKSAREVLNNLGIYKYEEPQDDLLPPDPLFP